MTYFINGALLLIAVFAFALTIQNIYLFIKQTDILRVKCILIRRRIKRLLFF